MQLDFSVGPSFSVFIMMCSSYTGLQIYNTLLVDKNHREPAAAQASSNLVRCTLAAIAVSFLQQLIDRVGVGWTFTLMGGLSLVATGCFAVDYHFGTVWRQQRLRAKASTA